MRSFLSAGCAFGFQHHGSEEHNGAVHFRLVATVITHVFVCRQRGTGRRERGPGAAGRHRTGTLVGPAVLVSVDVTETASLSRVGGVNNVREEAVGRRR